MSDLEVTITYEDMHAVHDHMGKTLHVYGTAHVQGGGFAVSIQPAAGPGGANQFMLMLALDVHVTGESPSTQQLDWTQSWDDEGIQYTEVGFVSEGAAAPVPPPLQIEDVY